MINLQELQPDNIILVRNRKFRVSCIIHNQGEEPKVNGSFLVEGDMSAGDFLAEDCYPFPLPTDFASHNTSLIEFLLDVFKIQTVYTHHIQNYLSSQFYNQINRLG
ncbi:MAG: hypothetical protein LUH10_05835 [Tannerellaceae bacterium]|nr:hypothetical protein [Tannerellaceae bacterium]